MTRIQAIQSVKAHFPMASHEFQTKKLNEWLEHELWVRTEQHKAKEALRQVYKTTIILLDDTCDNLIQKDGTIAGHNAYHANGYKVTINIEKCEGKAE